MTGLSAGGSEAAKRFLQTVVVVDDNAYKPKDPVENFTAGLGGESVALDDPEPEAGELAVDLGELDPLAFDTEKIVEGFADIGMNCAVIAPSPNDEERDITRLEQLASRSDVVILDWMIRPRGIDQGEVRTGDRTSLALLLDVLRRDLEAGGSRLRLICVYTGERNLEEILDKIVSALEMQLAPAQIERSGPRLTVGSARIVLLGKEQRTPIPGSRPVPADQLPSEIVREFAQFAADGLLPEIALDALSAVRDQSHRLLRRFSGKLDPALLSHRSVTSPAAAEQFALSLVGSELATIVAAANVTASLQDDRVEILVNEALADRATAFYWDSSVGGPKTLTHDQAIIALTRGIDDKMHIQGTEKKLPPKVSRSPLLLSGESTSVRAEASKIDMEFSALSSLARDRAFDGERVPTPELQLGSLLKLRSNPDSQITMRGLESSSDDRECECGASSPVYLLCLQPLCDCVRITEPRPFPLLPLRPSIESDGKFDFVISAEGKYVPLRKAGTKLAQMRLVEFRPDKERQVILAGWVEDGWQFEDTEGKIYEWLGSLRLDKAHKLLQNVVTAAGRIGIDEYEFFRLANG